MTTSAQSVATLFLQDLGAPVTPGNVSAVTVWLNHENSDPTLRNNPWNLHSPGGLPGQTGSAYVSSGDPDVAIFGTIQAGVLANARNLSALSSTYPQYGQAISALKSNNPTGFLSAIAASPWSAGHYRINGVPGTNALLQDYNGTGGSSGVSVSSGGHVSTGTTTLSGAQLTTFQTWLNASLGVGSGAAPAPAASGLGAFTSAHPVVWLLVGAVIIVALTQ